MTDSPTPTRLCLTGGRGRLASLIADYFRAPRHAVELYSRQAQPGFQPLDSLAKKSDWAPGDVLLHLAWSTLPATSEQHPGIEETVDLPLLDALLQGIASTPESKRPHLIFFSSGGAVYGNAPGRPSREDDPCRPIGHYGQAKLAAETKIRQAAANHGIAATILRISNPYGYPVPSGRQQGIIPHAIRAAADARPLQLWGDGGARKDFLYHTDFLSALEQIIAAKPTGTFNLCAGESHSIEEVIALVEKHTGRPVETVPGPAPAWDVANSRLDPQKLNRVLDWRPQVSLDEGIRRAVAGFMDH